MSMPQNPLYDMIRNWQRIATETVNTWRTRAETLRTQWYQRFYGPAATPTARIRPLMRLRMAQAPTRRVATMGTQAGRVIPHVTEKEPYDMTYRGPSGGAPVTAKRLGMEKEPWDFTF